MSSSVVVLGSINTDLVIRGPQLPGPGETVLGGKFYRAAGGKGANQAVAAARLGRDPVTFVAAVGDDDLGRSSLDAFTHENLDCRYIKTVAGKPSGVALILVDQAGENLISVASGANMELLPADIEALPESIFAEAQVLLTCLEIPPRTVAAGLKRAKAAGCRTILNPAPADRQILDLASLTDIDLVTPNELEAAALTGIPVSGVDSAAAAAQRLCELGFGAAIITLGAAGCLLAEGTQSIHLPSKRVDAVDTTAAGDAFNGALAVALAEGKSLADAARWATTAAARSVTRAGALPSLPTRSEL